ncbi:MAG: hypothetical protein LBS35_09595, partial [Synergistaceae bacterium]|nr:hypothetical protein [Synergistaceae bacterium]
FEDELDAIRVGLYEQTKDMTLGERLAYMKGRAEEISKQHGIRLVRLPVVRAAHKEKIQKNVMN